MPEQNKNNIPLLLVGLIIVMIMVITIIYNWTDDEPSTSTADKEPEPDPDENRTYLENRERRYATESQDSMPTREDIEMESEA